MTGDVGHGSTVLGPLFTEAYGITASSRSPAYAQSAFSLDPSR